MKHLFWTLVAFVLPLPVSADILNVQVVAPGIWAIEGPATQRDPENLGNNATFGLIETDDGAVLVDPGGTWAGAAMLHKVVRDLTEKKVTHVVNTGGQDHRWLGNGYWQDQGAIVIAANAAVEDQRTRASMQLSMLSQLVGTGLDGTEHAFATVTFKSEHLLKLGGRLIEIHHVGAAHTSGDSFVWLPQERIVFAGDIVYVGRTPGVMEFSDSAAWLESFVAIEALDPEHVVPGHGPLTTLAQAQADTRDYLQNLRDKMRAHIDEGGDIIESVNVDQSHFAYLDQFEALAGRNAQTVFQQMEWE